MFQKLVVVEPVNLTSYAKEKLSSYAYNVIFHDTVPSGDEEMTERIGDADGVLVSYTSTIGGQVLKACKNLRYVGMCCSLYAPENANVDILTAKELGIEVKGVRDYGDEGVREYVVSQLTSFLHGFGRPRWKEEPLELTNLEVGILGLGVTGAMVGKALRHFGAKVSYYSRTRKKDLEQENGFDFLPFAELLKKVDILCCCLNKNVILLGEEEFKTFGDGKIFMNTSIGPAHEIPALKGWLANRENFAFSDTPAGLGGMEFLELPNVFCVNKTAGTTSMSKVRLGLKVIQNIEDFLSQSDQ